MKTKILYIHGYGGKGGTKTALQELLGADYVVSGPVFYENALNSAQAFKNELASAKRHADEMKPDLIIASSLGGFLASFLTSYKRILINPCFQPSKFIPVFKTRMDESELQKLADFEKTIPGGQRDVWGLFSIDDDLFNEKGKEFQAEFKAKFNPGHFYTMVDGHKISDGNIRDKLVPMVQEIFGGNMKD